MRVTVPPPRCRVKSPVPHPTPRPSLRLPSPSTITCSPLLSSPFHGLLPSPFRNPRPGQLPSDPPSSPSRGGRAIFIQFLIRDPAHRRLPRRPRPVAGEDGRRGLLPDSAPADWILSGRTLILAVLNLGQVVVHTKGWSCRFGLGGLLMNSRRSRSVKLLSARAKPLEVDVAEEDPRMSSSADNTVYCCIAKGTKVIYRYSSKDGDSQTEATAALCLENVPPYHRHYIHSSGSRSYGYLMADGHTFFAIIDPSVGNAGALQFLERVRDEFRNTNRNGFHDAMVPAVQRLVASLEKMPRGALVLEYGTPSGGPHDGSSCTSSKVPLLGKGGGRKDKKKAKDKGVSTTDDGDEHHGTRGVRIDVAPEDAGGMSLERSTSQSRLRRQQSSRSLWVRHVKIIIIVDAVICVILFAAWLAVCKGFQCVSG